MQNGDTEGEGEISHLPSSQSPLKQELLKSVCKKTVTCKIYMYLMIFVVLFLCFFFFFNISRIYVYVSAVIPASVPLFCVAQKGKGKCGTIPPRQGL